ncbi:hypothetical protein ONZ45_g11021 [Pleurotus djamor]|nr:hypothetical protein ONZ45_g11021 [Pleurotus djamor]
MEFRKVLFMQKFGIHEQAYEAWIREWRNEKNKKPTTATATEAKGKNAQSHNFKQPPTPIAVPQGGAGPSHHRSEGKAKKPQFTATNNSTQASKSTGWESHTQPSTYNKHSRPLTLNELQGILHTSAVSSYLKPATPGNFSSPIRDDVAKPLSPDLNQQRCDGSNSSSN